MKMALFNTDEDESDGEVRLRYPDDENEEDTGKNGKLKEEAENKLGSSSSSSSSSSGGQLPGMGSTTSSSGSDVEMDDLHGQNERIIDLLKEIKSELKDDGGKTNELL